MITYGSNPITRTIELNNRIMLTGKTVFRITHINDFEYNGAYTGAIGIIKALVLQTALIKEDDIENNIAWNASSEAEEQPDLDSPKIVGDNVVMIGNKRKYDCSNDAESRSWELECSNKELKKYIEFEPFGFGNKWVTIKFPSMVQFVGETVDLKLYVSNKLVDTMTIEIKGL